MVQHCYRITWQTTYFYMILLCLLPFCSTAQQLTHRWGELLFQSRQAPNITHFQSLTVFSPDMKIEKTNSPFHIYKLQFDAGRVHEIALLEAVRRLPFVTAAQFNFFVERRNIPDDPFFHQQWPLVNIGQLGGIPDADIDIDLVWNSTTGGIGQQGDTIVLCLIDSGFDPYHSDLKNSYWKNFKEIPNNGVDDDNNGYIDDFAGWNVLTQTDAIQTTGPDAWHGTAVMGIAAATGNNSLGISGVNWQVKVLPVIHGNSIDQVIEAYSYPYTMRKLYNETAGQRGCYIVATNSSWGINFGQASNAPLWCAIYDSLGQEGILNVAATANLNVDVDQVGDLPTSCASDFLIAATATNRFDEKAANAAFGAMHIDIGAPGKDVFTTMPSNAYNFVSGTSFAAPHLSATIALLYASSCPSFSSLSKTEPAIAALDCRRYILDGADHLPSLQNLVQQNRRLNSFKSFQLLVDSCNFSGCFNPFAIEISTASIDQAIVSWDIGLSVSTTDLRIREMGLSDWELFSQVNSPFVVSNLQTCQVYELQFKTSCDSINNSWTRTYFFQTAGCCEPPKTFTFDFQTASSLSICWPEVSLATAYYFSYRPMGASQWDTISTTSNKLQLNQLAPCTDYEYQPGISCTGDSMIQFGAIQTFATYGCSNCLELDYCAASGPGSNNVSWITRFQLAEIDHTSENQFFGYSDFTQVSTPLLRGYSYPIRVESHNSGTIVPPVYAIWVDYNQDSDFDDPDELVFNMETDASFGTGTILLPADIPLGSTRLRLSARDASYSPCGTSGLLGEVEDYCIDIVAPDGCLPPINLRCVILGNTAQMNWRPQFEADGYRIRYKPLAASGWTYLYTSFTQLQLAGLDACTDHIYQIQSICDGEESTFSNEQQFSTSGCGSCIDFMYCSVSANSTFEWIDEIHLAGQAVHSANNGGYLSQSIVVFDLFADSSYTISIRPSWSNDVSNAYYRAWIDFNQNGQFEDATEQILDAGIAIADSIYIDNFNIPTDAVIGSTKMRVVMKQASAPASACDQGYFGEIEDHCVNILSPGSAPCNSPSELNWLLDSTSIQLFWTASVEATAYNVRYTQTGVSPKRWTNIQLAANHAFIQNLLPCQEYEFQLRAICEERLATFEQSWFLTTDCVVRSQNLPTSLPIEVYPNPFQKHFNIQSKEVLKLEVCLYDVHGRMVWPRRNLNITAQQPYSIQTDLPPGIYLLNINSGTQQQTFKLIAY